MEHHIKILVYGQSFNDFTGGGITISNLFKGWKKENIAVICLPYYLSNYSTEICNHYYQIGMEEYNWKFPFNLFKQKYPSGNKVEKLIKVKSVGNGRFGLKQIISDYLINPCIKWAGFSHCISGIEISARLKEWLDEFKPDILYIQVSDREGVLFAGSLIDYLKIPSVIHMMDDWPSTISTGGPLAKYWRTKIDKEFRQLLDMVDIHLSISSAMSAEYYRRYKKTFKAFHNPVDIRLFKLQDKKKITQANRLRILYLGRIGTANKQTILFFAGFISGLTIDGIGIELDIFSKDTDDPDLKVMRNIQNIRLKKPVRHDDVPALLKEYDLLLLPLDFSEEGLRFARFSIPTKASEYLISGTPVMVFAPRETAISKFCSDNDCGFCVTEISEKQLSDALHLLIRDDKCRERITNNAVRIAKTLFDADKVRSEFQELLINLCHHSIKITD